MPRKFIRPIQNKANKISSWNNGKAMPHNPHRQGQRLQRGTPANKYGEKKEGKSIQLTPTMWDALDELQKDEKADSRSEALEDLLRAMPELIEAANDFYKYWLENLSRQLNNE